MEALPSIDLRLVAAFFISGLFSLVVTIAAIVLVRRRYQADWKYLSYGLLVFFLSQVITRIPAVVVLQMLLSDFLQSSTTILLLWIGGLALTAGIFEEVGRYLGYKYLFKNGKTWRNALMYGLGHGGLEAVLLGSGAMLLSLINYIVISSMLFFQPQLAGDQAEQIRQAQAAFTAVPWWLPLLGGFERLAALIIQVSMAVVVLQSFLRGTKLWLYGAIIYHAVVDFAAVMVLRQYGAVMAEVMVGVFAVASLYIIWSLRSRNLTEGVHDTVS